MALTDLSLNTVSNFGFTDNNPLNSLNNIFGGAPAAPALNSAVPTATPAQAQTGFPTTDGFIPFDPSKQTVTTDAYNEASKFVNASPGASSITTSGEKAVATVRVGSKATGTGAHASNSLADINKGAATSTPNSAVSSAPTGASKDVSANANAPSSDLASTIGQLLQLVQKLLQDLLGPAAGGAGQLQGAPKDGAPSADQLAAGKEEIKSKLTSYAMGHGLLGKTPLLKNFDRNGDAALDSQELAQMLTSAGVGATSGVPVSTYVNGMMSQVDTNKDGKISVAEFEATN